MATNIERFPRGIDEFVSVVEKAVNSIERFWPGLLESLAKRFEDAETPARKELREKSEALQKARPDWSPAKARLEVYRRNPDLVEAIGQEDV